MVSSICNKGGFWSSNEQVRGGGGGLTYLASSTGVCWDSQFVNTEILQKLGTSLNE